MNFGIVDNRFLARSVGLLNPKSPLLLSQDSTVAEAIAILQREKIGAIVTTDNNGKIAGIFTERDIVLKVICKHTDFDSIEVSKVHTANPQTIEMTSSIAFALNMMSQGGYRHIPIVEDDQIPVGMISVKDIIDYIVTAITKDLNVV
jgi:CBS domain-containing protein